MVTQERIVTHVPFEVQGTYESPRKTRRTPRGKYAAVDLFVIDTSGNRRLTLAQLPSTQVVGIYSTKPGMLGITHKIEERAGSDEVPLAVVGIVPCKVSAENGPIQAGALPSQA